MMRSDRVFILPCRIGDRVFCIRNYRGTKIPKDGIVSNMHFSKNMELIIEVKYVGQGVWGKKIFGTYEDAAKAVNGVVADGKDDAVCGVTHTPCTRCNPGPCNSRKDDGRKRE